VPCPHRVICKQTSFVCAEKESGLRITILQEHELSCSVVSRTVVVGKNIDEGIDVALTRCDRHPTMNRSLEHIVVPGGAHDNFFNANLGEAWIARVRRAPRDRAEDLEYVLVYRSSSKVRSTYCSRYVRFA
jgi:hypothetical protein